MKRRDIEVFNLSFLDVLSGALGAVLFLFIVVPKGGGKAPAVQPQLNLTFDTVYNKFYGDIPDSLLFAQAGDSLLALVVDYDIMPSIKDCPPPKACPECPDDNGLRKRISSLERQLNTQNMKNNRLAQTVKKQEKSIAQSSSKTTSQTKTEASRPASSYRGDLPSVPCKFSVEINWKDITDNVDLHLCKEGNCVNGAPSKRRNSAIGYWDSGKSKTSLFGGDLRTTQEAIRQFDNIIEGTYEIYAQYKGAETPKSDIVVNGLVYTKTDELGENGDQFTITLPYNEKKTTKVGTIELRADGSFTFNQQN